MSKINYQRVILGGLLAGLIIDIVEWLVNGVIFAGDWAAVMSSRSAWCRITRRSH